MCGRYNLITDAKGLMVFFEVLETEIDLSTISPHYNIAPSQRVPVIRQGTSGRQLTMMRWGLVPFWPKGCAHAGLCRHLGYLEGGNRGRYARIFLDYHNSVEYGHKTDS